MLEYKGYHTVAKYSKKDNVFFGKIEGIKALVLFEAKTKNETSQKFHEAVDEYLNYCKKYKVTPEKEDKTKLLIQYAREELKELNPYVNGNQRPNDLMDCGMADGEWNTWIRVLDFMGVNHKYTEV